MNNVVPNSNKMNTETIVSARPDREIKKTIITPGDYSIVPYEDARCKIILSDIQCINEAGICEIEPESRIFSSSFNGIVLVGDCDSFIDKDIELVLQQMCSGETCVAKLVYRDNEGRVVKEISCKIELNEVMEEQLISDWGWERLFEAALHHKERGVELVKEKRIADAFRRFNKSLKMLVAIQPVDPKVVTVEKVNEMGDLKTKLYNNLAHCQLHFKEYEAALELCKRALSNDPGNVKALYRRCVAYEGMNLYEAAWTDIQEVLLLDPNDKTAQIRANTLRPKVEKIKNDYSNVIKNMFR